MRARRPRREDSAAAAGRCHRSQLADKLLDLETIKVDDIMIPRSEIASIDISDDWDTILDTLRTTPHTRLPVCEDNLDNIVGILHMKKVAHALARGDFDASSLLQLAREREALFRSRRHDARACSCRIFSATAGASRWSSTSTATFAAW